MTFLHDLDYSVRHGVCYCLVLVGLMFGTVAEGLIRLGAWIADVDISDIEL